MRLWRQSGKGKGGNAGMWYNMQPSMAKEAKNILLVVGDDDYAVEAEAKGAIARIVPEECRESAVEIVSGDATNAESQLASIRQCLSSVQTPPFLDPVKLTWWKGVSFFPGGGRGGRIAEEVKDTLERFADTLVNGPLPENQFLLITATTLLSTSIFAKRMKAISDARDCSVPSRSKDRSAAALVRLAALASAERLTFAPGADRAFVAKTGPDTRTIASELAKMRTYLGEDAHEVTAADIAAITSAGGDETEIWALTDALASRNAARVISTLRCFQGDSNWPIMISNVVERWFRGLIAAKAGGGDGSFKARKDAAAAAAFSMTELRIGRYRMLALREKLVSSQPTPEYVEMEILRTVMPKSRR